MISSRKGVNREAIGRQKWDPGEKHVKIHIVLEVKSMMYQNIQKSEIENPLKNLCNFDDFEPLGGPRSQNTHNFLLFFDDLELAPGIRGSPRNPRKWCQEVLLRPHLHTRRGPG